MKIGIVGVGLIGGSIGLALRDPSRRILGVEPNPASRTKALERACIDEAVELDALAQTEVVFVCTPPERTVDAVSRVLAVTPPETLVTDCASIKGAIADAFSREPRFVPGHPMAGHEKSGPAFASAWLYRGARWILTPGPKTAKSGVRTVEKLIKAMGAEPVRMEADRHDRQVALVSHLPHVLASALLIAAQADNPLATGGSWRDLTRVGGAEPELWQQILLGNRAAVANVLRDFEAQLAEVRASLEEGDAEAVRAFFERAKLARPE